MAAGAKRSTRTKAQIGAAASEGPILAGQPNRIRFDEADNKPLPQRGRGQRHVRKFLTSQSKGRTQESDLR
jgi:hypothetical protein